MSLSLKLQTIWYVEADENYDVKMFYHPEMHFIALRTVKGTGMIRIKGKGDFLLAANTLFLTEAREIIKYASEGKEWVFWWFEFSGETAGQIDFYRLFFFDYEPFEELRLKNMFANLNSGKGNREIYASCEFSAAVANWSAELNQEAKNKKMLLVLEYISQNLTGSIKIKDLTQIANLSERAFRHAFLQFTGKSPKQYIEDKILNSAQELLKNTDLTVKEVAFSLGYEDPYYFSRAFKKKYGTAPREYRLKPKQADQL